MCTTVINTTVMALPVGLEVGPPKASLKLCPGQSCVHEMLKLKPDIRLTQMHCWKGLGLENNICQNED